MNLRLIALLVLVASLIVGCGKKGSPEAPELSAPSPIRGLNIAGDVRGVLLRWAAPATTASDDELTDLTGFAVERSPVVPGERAQFELIADITVPAIGQGDTVNFQYHDAAVQPGRAYEYRVVPYNREGIRAKEPRVMRVVFLGESTTVEVY